MNTAPSPLISSPWLPWNDRVGRFDRLRAIAFLAAVAPLVWLVWRAASGTLGARPITEAIHFTGDWSLRLLLATMSVTPLRILTGYNKLVGIRRQLGVATFLYAALHFVLYWFDQSLDIGRIASEIAIRTYLTIGFIALVGLGALAWTSFDGAIRRMGAVKWGRLHGLIHGLMALIVVHALLQSKLDITEPAMLLGGFLMGEFLRLYARFNPRPGVAPVAALALLAGVATALLESLWYATATRVPAMRVLAGNLDVDFDYLILRPSWVVLAVCLALVPLVLLRPAAPAPRQRSR